MHANAVPPPITFGSFGTMLRYLRRRARMQQRDLAIAVGYSESQICRLEQNQRLPDITTLAALFVPALGLEREPDLAGQLLELAAAARGEQPGRPAPTAPPRAAATPAENLPTPLTPLIDRTREAAAARQAIERDGLRLLTLVGPPGIGKTRLAIHIASELRGSFADGVYFAALAPIRDPGLVLPTIAHALGVKCHADQPLLDGLRDALHGRRILLVLDNFEQILAAAPLVAELLRAAPLLKVLVTSRAALHLSGEHLFVVPPLGLPEGRVLPQPAQLLAYPAIQLFLARVQAINPAFAPTASDMRTVAEICACLDGLPLAIELAAARSRLFSPQTLLERLRGASGARMLQFLVDGPRDLPSHQQTLRGTIDWSYELLDVPERALLLRLAVFVGGCTAEAIEAVCGDYSDTQRPALAGLQALVDQSLVRCEIGVGGQPRFSLLEMIGEYAREKLAQTGQAGALRRRHAAFYLALAQRAAGELSGAQQECWFQRLEAEFTNLRAALEWLATDNLEHALLLASSLRQFWPMRDYLPEARARLTALLRDPRAQRVALPVRARALGAAGFLAYQQGDLRQAQAYSDEALAISRACGDQRGIADALCNLGSVAFYKNDYAAAAALYTECLGLYRNLGARADLALALKNLGLVAKDQGNYAHAVTLFSESLAICRELGDKRGVAQALFNQGVVAYWQGDFTASVELSKQSATSYRDLGDAMGTAYALDNLGMAAYRLGDLQQAIAMLDESLQLFREVGDRMGLALLLTDMGTVVQARGDWPAARRLFREGMVVSEQVGDKRRIAFCLEGLALAQPPEHCLCAARLLGAAEALRAAIGAPLPPSEVCAYAEGVGALRQHCTDDRAFESAWAAGRQAELDELLAEVCIPAPGMRMLQVGRAGTLQPK